MEQVLLVDGFPKETLAAIISKKVKLATIVEGDPKAPFSIATTPVKVKKFDHQMETKTSLTLLLVFWKGLH